MSTTVKVLIRSKAAEVAQTTQYTAIAVKAAIDKFTVTNTTAGNITFAVNLVSSGGASGAANLILSKTILAGQCYICPELIGHTLDQGDFISTIAGGAGLTIRASGREISID